MFYNTTDQLGIRKRQFDPAIDDNLVFIVVLDPRYSVALRDMLMRPDGVQHGSWRQDLPALASAGSWRSQTPYWSVRSLAAQPDQWHLLLFVDDKPMGRYNFSVAGLPASLMPGWWTAVPRLEEKVSWSGASGPDGLAIGTGVEEFRHHGGLTRYEGELLAGKKNGTGTLPWSNGNRYTGRPFAEC